MFPDNGSRPRLRRKPMSRRGGRGRRARPAGGTIVPVGGSGPWPHNIQTENYVPRKPRLPDRVLGTPSMPGRSNEAGRPGVRALTPTPHADPGCGRWAKGQHVARRVWTRAGNRGREAAVSTISRSTQSWIRLDAPCADACGWHSITRSKRAWIGEIGVCYWMLHCLSAEVWTVVVWLQISATATDPTVTKGLMTTFGLALKTYSRKFGTPCSLSGITYDASKGRFIDGILVSTDFAPE